MKLSVSLHDDDVAFLDRYAEDRGRPSRSAALKDAVALLRESELGEEYAEAGEEWASTDEAALWDSTVGDGLGSPSDATR